MREGSSSLHDALGSWPPSSDSFHAYNSAWSQMASRVPCDSIGRQRQSMTLCLQHGTRAEPSITETCVYSHVLHDKHSF